MDTNKKPQVVLIGEILQNPFTGNLCLHGRVYGHPRFTDGDEIYTSAICSVQGDLVETRNTLYLVKLESGDGI